MTGFDNIKNTLSEKGLKPTYQRIKIYEYLLDNKEHPTIDNIYHSLYSQIPTLSKTTVYNTIKLFEKKKIINFILIEEHELRVDPDTSSHGHFKCIQCGKLFDIDIRPESFNYHLNDNYEINEYHIYLKGYCNKCKSLKKED